jgi:hypothetical protein
MDIKSNVAAAEEAVSGFTISNQHPEYASLNGSNLAGILDAVAFSYDMITIIIQLEKDIKTQSDKIPALARIISDRDKSDAKDMRQLI